jgi:glutaredoxin
MAGDAILYTHPECSICGTVKLELAEKGTVYVEVDLGQQPERWPEVEALTKGDRITPVLLEDGKVTIGYRGIGCNFYA